MSDILPRLIARAQDSPISLARRVRYRFAPVGEHAEAWPGHEGGGTLTEAFRTQTDARAETLARRQHSAGHVKVVAIGPSTGGGAGPEGERIGGVGQNGRHADEQKRREGYETASAGDRVLGPTQSASDKKENGLIEPQG